MLAQSWPFISLPCQQQGALTANDHLTLLGHACRKPKMSTTKYAVLVVLSVILDIPAGIVVANALDAKSSHPWRLGCMMCLSSDGELSAGIAGGPTPVN